MKKFLFYAFLLWAGVFLWSSTASANWIHQETLCIYGPNPCPTSTVNDFLARYQVDGIPAYVGPGYTSYDRRRAYVWNTSEPYTGGGTCDSSSNSCNDVADPSDTPATCLEQGVYWEESSGSCVASCPGGRLDHYCLEQAPVGEPDTDQDGNICETSSPDYQGVFEGKHYCDSNLPEPASCPSGQMAYIQTDTDGSGAFVCGAPISSPDEAGDSTDTETTTTTTDAEGNTTTTTTDQDGNTTTTTDDGAGNSTTVNNYPGTDSETGGPCTASSVACYPADDTDKGFCKDGGSLCDDVNDIKEAVDLESTRTEKTGEFKVTEAEAAVVTAETELTNGLDAIKAEIGGYFDLALSGGDIVCGPGVQVLGTTIQICPSEMKEELAVIAQIVMLIAGLISLMIIFR